MYNYRIANKAQLDAWINEKMALGRGLTAIKNPAPADAVYSDGNPCTGLVNIAWQCVQTGEVFAIEYEKESDNE